MQQQSTLEKLNASSLFPAHGWTSDPEGCTYLVFPILRAFQPQWQPVLGGEPQQATPGILARDAYRSGHFRELFFRILSILNKISIAEATIRATWPRDGSTMEDVARFNDAHQMFPIYVEIFYSYFRMLADRLVVALAPILSNAVASFPREYKTLLEGANSGADRSTWGCWGWKVDPNPFLAAVKANSEWYTLLVGPIGDCPKGIRDTLNHRLVSMRPILHGDPPDDSYLELYFEGLEGDIPRIELFLTVNTAITSFCQLLSSFPPDLWSPTSNYVNGDFALVSDGQLPEVCRVFPRIL